MQKTIFCLLGLGGQEFFARVCSIHRGGDIIIATQKRLLTSIMHYTCLKIKVWQYFIQPLMYSSGISLRNPDKWWKSFRSAHTVHIKKCSPASRSQGNRAHLSQHWYYACSGRSSSGTCFFRKQPPSLKAIYFWDNTEMLPPISTVLARHVSITYSFIKDISFLYSLHMFNLLFERRIVLPK